MAMGAVRFMGCRAAKVVRPLGGLGLPLRFRVVAQQKGPWAIHVYEVGRAHLGLTNGCLVKALRGASDGWVN